MGNQTNALFYLQHYKKMQDISYQLQKKSQIGTTEENKSMFTDFTISILYNMVNSLDVNTERKTEILNSAFTNSNIDASAFEIIDDYDNCGSLATLLYMITAFGVNDEANYWIINLNRAHAIDDLNIFETFLQTTKDYLIAIEKSLLEMFPDSGLGNFSVDYINSVEKEISNLTFTPPTEPIL